jgi:hypothetical protein
MQEQLSAKVAEGNSKAARASRARVCFIGILLIRYGGWSRPGRLDNG